MNITNQLINDLDSVVKKYEVTLSYHEECSDNNGASCSDDIYIGKINNYQIGVLIFFHELSHILNERKMRDYGMEYHINGTVSEGAAWFNTIFLMRKNGYKVSTLYDSLEYKYIRKSISTYFENDIDEVNSENFNITELRCKLKIGNYWDRMVQLLKYLDISYNNICIETIPNVNYSNKLIIIPVSNKNEKNNVIDKIEKFYKMIENDVEGDANKSLIIKSLKYTVVKKGNYYLIYFYKFEVDDEMIEGYNIQSILSKNFG